MPAIKHILTKSYINFQFTEQSSLPLNYHKIKYTCVRIVYFFQNNSHYKNIYIHYPGFVCKTSVVLIRNLQLNNLRIIYL